MMKEDRVIYKKSGEPKPPAPPMFRKPSHGFISVRELSKATGVGPAEIVRIARYLGKKDSTLLPLGDHVYVKPGKRAKLSYGVAIMIKNGARR